MTKQAFAAIMLASGMIATTAPAGAAVLIFTGTATASTAPFADPSCAPLPFRSITPPGSVIGTSSLGSFGYSSNVCTGGAPVGLVTGVFDFDFGYGAFSGVLDGTTMPSGTFGLLNQAFTYTVTGGTGKFAGATGSFTNVGTVDVRNPPTRVNLNFSGLIDAPAVPEPATWALMLLGFAGVGVALRWRNLARYPAGTPTNPFDRIASK